MTSWSEMGEGYRSVRVPALLAALTSSLVPDHLHEGLARYFREGILPGGFLQAVLGNNLLYAVKRADPVSYESMTFLLDFLLEHAPASSWGSREKVLAWTTTPERLEI